MPSPAHAPSSPRRRHTIVLSDVHLSQAHPDDPSDPLWMRYRRAEFHPDEDFAGLVDHLLSTRGDDALEIAWNGDVFDFVRVNVKAGDENHVFFAINQLNVAFFCDITDIARGQKAIFSKYFIGFFRLIPITAHDLRATNKQFAMFSLR